MKKLLVESKLTKNEMQKLIGDENTSKSLKMKQLFENGLEIKEIAELLKVRYNFVYNVISNYVNINEIEVENVERNSRKNEIIELFLKGNTNVEISKLLKVNYNYVFKVIKEFKVTNESKVNNA